MGKYPILVVKNDPDHKMLAIGGWHKPDFDTLGLSPLLRIFDAYVSNNVFNPNNVGDRVS